MYILLGVNCQYRVKSFNPILLLRMEVYDGKERTDHKG